MVVQFSFLGGREGRPSAQFQRTADPSRVATVTASLGSCRRLISRPAVSTADGGVLLSLACLMDTPFPRCAPGSAVSSHRRAALVTFAQGYISLL
jgi:hypothetical protein